MSKYDDPVAALRAHVKEMQAKARQKYREAQDARLAGDMLDHAAIELDLLADKIERAQQVPA